MLLELKNIRKSFSSSSRAQRALLDGVSLSVDKGGVTALIGGNGAGKTTLFNIISGFDKDFEGHVFFRDRDITRLPSWKVGRLGIGRLFQGRQLMEDLTLLENMMIASDNISSEAPFASLFHGKRVRESEKAKQEHAEELLVRFFGEGNKYMDKLNDKASELSYGEQRLIAFVRLLMDRREGSDRLLLLDEPTSGVNPEHINTLRSLIGQMMQEDGLTVLMIEHNMNFVRSVADDCYYLADGRIKRSGSVSEVLDDPDIRKNYLGL